MIRSVRFPAKSICLLAFSAFIGVAHSQNVNVTGALVGNGTYATLGLAFTGINSGAQTGAAIQIDVVNNTGEAATGATLNAGAWASVTINPVGARIISGTTNAGSPLVNLNGADNVTINGLNTGGNSLTITNLSTGATAGTSTIRFINDATNNTVTNCTVLGSTLSTPSIAAGTIVFHTSTATGNDGNTISACDIGPSSAGLPSKAIVSVGSTVNLTRYNSGNQILNNRIFDFFIATDNCYGISMTIGADNWTVSGNRIYQTATRTFTSAGMRYTGIYANNNTLAFSNSHTISNNIIGFASSSGTGTTTLAGSSNQFRGIDLDNLGITLSSIQGNTISGIVQTTSSQSTNSELAGFIAIKVGGASEDAPANIGGTTGNTIGSLDGSSGIVINASSTIANTAPAVAIYDWNFSSITIANNSIGTITINNGGTGTRVGFRGIFINSTTGVTKTITNNIIGGTAAGSITDNIVGTYAMYGIQCATANINATGNIIRNMTSNSNTAGAIVSSAMLLSGSTGANTISGNQVYGLHNNSGAGSGSIYALSLSIPNTAGNLIERNSIHSLSMTASVNTGQVVGIISRAVNGSATYRNNMVRLGLDASGATVTLGCLWVGIWDSYSGITGGSNNFYHNSAYIGGTGVTAVSNTFAFYGQVLANTRDYRNNIFWNARSNATAGGTAHVAILLAGTAPNPAGLTCDYNDLFANGTDGVIGVYNSLIQNPIGTWRTATNRDLNSINADPLFIAPNGTAATGDLHIQKTSNSPIDAAGTLIASVTNDFDNETRSTNSPVDIGADAGNFAVWYSQGTGSVSDPIWARVPVGTPGPATWPASMIAQNGHIVTNTGTVSVMDLTVDAGGTLSLAGASTFNVMDDAVNVNGTLNGTDNSMLQLNGSLATTLALASTASLWDLTVNTSAGTTVTGNLEMRGTLLLNSGNFNASSANVTLNSTATETGSLGPVGATASYTGNLRIERYRPAGLTNWMLMGSPIQNRAVTHWQDDFITAGYPGSQFPNFHDPPGSGIFWPSIRWYDESNTGANMNDGLQGVGSNTQPLTTGQGFAVWAGSGLVNTTAFEVDLEAEAPVIASTPINLPVTYTSTGNPTTDGWNLVSNPLPSPIDFELMNLGSSIQEVVHFFSPAAGNIATYDRFNNSFTNGATNVIQSMQGFFLKATSNADATASVHESHKVSGNTGGMFGTGEQVVPALRLRIASGINTFSDETVVVFDGGTPALDDNDILKFVLAHNAAPQIATLAPNGTMIAINAYGTMANGITIPVSVNAGVTGEYTITVSEQGELGLTCITLEDLATGAITPMSNGATYTFQLDAADDETVARFLIHATAPALLYAEDAACGGQANGQATIVAQGGPHDITWRNIAGEVLLVQTGISSGVATITGLEAGGYSVSVTTETCGTLSRDFSISAPFVLEGQAFATNATCPDALDGSIDLMPLGGTAPYAFLWNDDAASTSEDLIAAPGNYAVTITDANGCAWTSDEVAIGHEGPVATMLNTPVTALVNDPVQFTAADADAAYFWSFGDGATSDVQNPVHAFELPGTYTVVLFIDNGLCTDATSSEIIIELSTSITEVAPVRHSAWATPQGIVVEHAFQSNDAVNVDLLDATGRLVIARRMSAQRMVLPAEGLSSGLWFVRLSNGSSQATLRVPLTR